MIAALRGHPGIDAIEAVNHHQALAWSDQWKEVDVVIVDAADERSGSADKLPGVDVVARVRTSQPDRHAVVVVVTSYFYHEGLRWRMREAGADLFFHRSELPTGADLARMVVHPEGFARFAVPPVEEGTASSLGVGPTARVNEFVRVVDEQNLTDVLSGEAPGSLLHSRRWLRIRKMLGIAAGIGAVNSDGYPSAHQDRAGPSTPQLRKLYRWLTHVDAPKDRRPDDPEVWPGS